jgi:hypothetical protein
MTIILNPFDPKNSAMAQCYHGVYRTDNLDDDTPTWTLKANIPAPNYLWHGAASICQEGLWLVVGFWNNVGAGEWYSRGWVTLNGGEDWTNFWIYPGVEGKWCKCELSSHDATKAWVQSFHAAGGAVRACASSNINGGAPTFSYTTLWNNASDALCCNPYHRFLDNDNDLVALWAGEQGNAPVSGRTKFCTNDAASCTETTLGAFDPKWCGGYTWGTDKYWVLCDYNKFFVSSDGINWTLQSTLPGVTRAISGWPYLGGRFYAAQDGTTAPLLVSSDEGATWTEQTGNWAEVGGNKDIYSLVPVWVA